MNPRPFDYELLGQIDPVTTEAVPKFEALVKLPGQSQADRTLVKLEQKPAPTTAPDSTNTAPSSTPLLDKAFSNLPHHPIP
ncbi:hypothetical protein [Microcoleus anatoxicus]|uniref:Uncharacterized protein n=1 Tax=Microcoleus anatoxicus PTRS2 TaxID=2705321 RepID=A0ABU8YQ14_9CYAN